MTVLQYTQDMIIGQKWNVEVHFFSEPNEFEDELIEETETYHYDIPCMKRCAFLNDEVSFFRVSGGTITLVVNHCRYPEE